MPIFLDEDMVGQDGAEICYPHLLLCMGVTVLMADGHLIGAHFTTPSTEAGVGAELARQIADYTANHHEGMHHLYCAANVGMHVGSAGGANVRGKAAMIGFHGDAYTFDSSSIKPKDGTFVSVRSNGPAHKCSIFYKRDEKARPVYQAGTGANVSLISSYKGTQFNVPSAKTGLSAPIHKLHEANFLLQMKHVNIP